MLQQSISTEEEYLAALARLEELFEAKGAKEKEEYDSLSHLIEDYEDSLIDDEDDEE